MVTLTLSRDAHSVITRLQITKRQYYLKLNRLIKAGLAIRKRSKYFLTSFGKVVYQSLILIEQAVEDHWKLNVIDSIERLPNHDMPVGERMKIVESLIDRKKFKKILLNYNIPSVRRKEVTTTRGLAVSMKCRNE